MAVQWEVKPSGEDMQRAAGAAFGYDDKEDDPRLGRRLRYWWVLSMMAMALYLVARAAS